MKFKRKCLFFVSLIFSFNLFTHIPKADDFLDLSAKNVIVMDFNTGEVVYENNSKEKVQIASTTKIMTALLLAENKEKTDLINVTEKAMAQPSSSFYKDYDGSLTTRDSFTAEDAMKGLLMISGNDIAVAIAESISGSEESFSLLMDEKAKAIGMLDSDFYTASGLDTDSVLDGNNHYSTAYDMALLAIEAYKNPWVRDAITTEKYSIGVVDGFKFDIENSNKNIGFNGCIGGKTGFTTKAQRCLVAFYKKEGRLLVGVVLGGKNPDYFNDMNEVVDYSLSIDREVIKESGAVSGFNYFIHNLWGLFDKNLKKEYPMILNEDVYMYNNELNNESVEYEVIQNPVSVWDVRYDTVVGILKVKEPNRETNYKLYMDEDTLNYISNFKVKTVRTFFFIIFTILAIYVYRFINKSNKKQK